MDAFKNINDLFLLYSCSHCLKNEHTSLLEKDYNGVCFLLNLTLNKIPSLHWLNKVQLPYHHYTVFYIQIGGHSMAKNPVENYKASRIATWLKHVSLPL